MVERRRIEPHEARDVVRERPHAGGRAARQDGDDDRQRQRVALAQARPQSQRIASIVTPSQARMEFTPA